MDGKIKRVALIGPESTGKTTLCEQLSDYFNTVWVPEYARDFVKQLDRRYTLEDIEYCAKKQLELDLELSMQANGLLFSDTELILTKIWCEDIFKVCPAWIEVEILKNKFDLYLLTCPDLTFMEDPVRENPDRRTYFFDLYKKELEKRKFMFSIIEGTGNSRFENALKGIEEWLLRKEVD